jgi:uncharacterized protein YhaN
VFFGALFQTVKGGYDAITIRRKIKECRKELDEELLGELGSYERFAATERLLMAEYMIELSKLQARGSGLSELLRLRERVNQRMKKAIEDAQAELEARMATKLDVAKLVANLRELSLAIDRDLTGFRKEFQSEQKKMQAGIETLEKQLKEQSERIERQSSRALSLEKKAQTYFETLEGLGKEFKVLTSGVSRRAALIWVFNILVVGLVLYLIWR